MASTVTRPVNGPSRRSRLLFALLCAGVVAAGLLGVEAHRRHALPVPEWPLAIDLFVVLPLAYLLLLRPGVRQALLGLGAILSLGVLFGALVLPDEHKQLWRWLEPLRWVALAALLAWQAWALAQIAWRLGRAPAGANLEQVLHASFERRFGSGMLTELLKLEGRMWLYAVCRDASRLRFDAAAPFHAHRQGGNASNQLGFLLLVAVELPLAHVLLHLFSPTLAVVVSAATAYGLLFLLAEYRATRLRPITVTPTGVHLRYGVFTDLHLPRSAVVDVQAVHATPRRGARRMRLVGMGRANVLLRLAEGTRLRTPFGDREVAELYIGLDDPARFIAALRHDAS